MSITRLFSSIIPAIVVTFGLLLLMHALVKSNMKEPKEAEETSDP